MALSRTSEEGLHDYMYPVNRFLLAGISVAAALLCARPVGAADCNGNGEDDTAEIAAGRASDCNQNAVPDSCDVVASRPGLGVRMRFELATPAPALAAGDLDGNGRPEVITGTQSGAMGLHVHFQDASGSFGPPSGVSTGSEGISAVETADFDGDGDLDVAATSAPSLRVSWLRGDGAGELGELDLIGADTPTNLLARDLDGDGRLDMAYTSLNAVTVVVLWNDGPSGFTELVLPMDSRATSLAASDLQGDGRLDLVIGHEMNALTVHRGIAGRRFLLEIRQPLPATPTDVLADDMTGDGAPEILVLAQQLLVFQNDGLGALMSALIHAAGPSPLSMESIDMDTDGRLDIAVMNWDASCNEPDHALYLARNLGIGNFAPPVTSPGGPSSSHAVPAIRAADMNGDGIEDAVTTAGAGAAHPGYATILAPAFEAESIDCDSNGIPDECDPDCNSNTIPDACDLASLSSYDADLDAVPDECQRDCNRNGRPDTLEVARGESPDLDGSGFPDECEVVAGGDCDENGIPDAVEIGNGAAPDCNGNGRPDSCDLQRRFNFDSLQGYSTPLRETGPLTAADMDGDGVMDFAVATRGACCPSTPHSGGIALFRGLGDGRFANLGEQSLAGEPSALEAADIDADGDQDLVAATVTTCRLTDSIALFRNGGKAGFGKPEAVSVGGRPSALALADMEADGSPDILVIMATFSGTSARIFANDGKGAFSRGPQDIATGIEAWHATAVDLNGDSLLDVVSAGPDPGFVRVFLASGGLRFREPRSIAATRPAHVAPGDLDGDGDQDLVVLAQMADHLVPGALGVLWNDGQGGFPTTTNLTTGLHAFLAEVKDLDRDGRGDIVLFGVPQGFLSGHWTGVFGTILGLGSGSFAQPSRFVIDGLIDRGIAADIDGDDAPDILATLENDDLRNRVFIASNTGRGGFRTGGRMDVEGLPGSLAAADLDADGKIDLAVANAEAMGLGVFWNADRGALSGPEEHVLPTGVNAMDPADLDGDGDTDLAAALTFGVQIFLNSGRRPLELGARLVLGSSTAGIAARDLDGDGDTDIVTANTHFQEFEDNVSVFENLGGGRFAAARNFVSGRRPSSMTAGDFDADGDVDLAIRNLDPSNIGFLANDGRGVFSRRTAVNVHDQAFFISALDADEDGDADLAVGPGFRFLLNRGGWGFDWGADPIEASSNFAMGTGDLDGDGVPEIINGISTDFEIFPNLGGGRLGPPSGVYPDGGGGSGSISHSIQGLAVADLDGDGRNDLAGSVQYERSFITVLLNRTLGYSLDTDGDGVPDECGSEPFRRGDSNVDGLVDLSDAIYILRSLFLGGEPVVCLKAADANDDSRVDVSDPVKILGTLFLGEPDLPAPSGTCGADPTGDALGCADFEGCA